MVEVYLKNDPIRLIWYPSNESPSNQVEGQRWKYANRPRVWRPPTDVYETEQALIVRVEIGGMRESDFTIYLDERHLRIHATRNDTPERRAYHQMEILFGEFSVEIELPLPIASDGVEAFYQEGILKVVLPKAQPHQVSIAKD